MLRRRRSADTAKWSAACHFTLVVTYSRLRPLIRVLLSNLNSLFRRDCVPYLLIPFIFVYVSIFPPFSPVSHSSPRPRHSTNISSSLRAFFMHASSSFAKHTVCMKMNLQLDCYWKNWTTICFRCIFSARPPRSLVLEIVHALESLLTSIFECDSLNTCYFYWKFIEV